MSGNIAVTGISLEVITIVMEKLCFPFFC